MSASNRGFTGLPLLSGPPPEPHPNDRSENSCRKCNKEFIVIFARGRRCNHCGFMYCHSCSDYLALMPRWNTTESGYDIKPVCAFCIPYLTITACGKAALRNEPISKLKNYMKAYNIRLGAGTIEKDDIIDKIIAARGPNGCLLPYHENYYRRHAVPSGQNTRSRGPVPRPGPTQANQNPNSRFGWASPNTFERPHQERRHEDFESTGPYGPPPGRQYEPPPGPPPGFNWNAFPFSNGHVPSASNFHSSGSSPSNYNSHPPNPPFHTPNLSSQNRPSNNQADVTRDDRVNREATEAPKPRPKAKPPSLDELLEMDEESIGTLSTSILKAILDENHVAARLVLEKSELVQRVRALVSSEREERLHNAALKEREEWEAQERLFELREQERMERDRRGEQQVDTSGQRQQTGPFRATVESVSDDDGDDAEISDPSPTFSEDAKVEAEAAVTPKTPPNSRPYQERGGLCVVCQDEDANIVIVDCGHLALCRACSKLIWESTRECPLCRIRIVTESRLLRVFKA